MEYEDRLRLRTPEGVDLELVLAGMGSRMLAGMFDFVAQWLCALAYYLLVNAVGLDEALSTAGWAIFGFLLLLGYDVGFEVLARGRTPGKRLTGLRVMTADGEPVGLVTSSIRNVLRIIDLLPGLYTVGIVSIFVTRKNQRLGDLVAGTVVVRERLGGRQDNDSEGLPIDHFLQRHRDIAERVDVSAISAEEVATVRRYLDRRNSLAPGAADQIARQISQQLTPRIGGLPPYTPPEAVLEIVVAAKSLRR